MKKEIYKIKCPNHIVFGDPLYFEEFKGTKLKKLVVDYKPPNHFDAARLVLLEQENEEYPESIDRTMCLYLAPHQTIETYASGLRYNIQKINEKEIGVDTARYQLSIDGRYEEIHTGADGWWGNFHELYRQVREHHITDAVRLTVAMPENYSFDQMKQLAEYFFEDMQPVIPKQEKKNDAPTR